MSVWAGVDDAAETVTTVTAEVSNVLDSAAANARVAAELSAPAQALADARLDLVQLIRDGIPPRTFVPGCEPWMLAGKRYLMPAPAGVGKSLAGLVIAVEIVANGGTVAIIDVENGQDEYARRLQDVLDSRDETAAQACTDRLRYYAFPTVRIDWEPSEWAAALAGVDLVILDSSRMLLTGAGLDENVADDYARFAGALLMPLARAGIATLVLDNTGHEASDRARGTKSKDDLNECVYALKVTKAFDRSVTGELHLIRKRTRFAELPERLSMTLGGGQYSAPVPDSPDPAETFRPTGYMERVSRIVEDNPGLNREDILALVHGKREHASPALSILISEGHVHVEQDGRQKLHRSIKPYREAHDERA